MEVAVAVVLARFSGLYIGIPVTPEAREGCGISLLRTKHGGDLPDPLWDPVTTKTDVLRKELASQKKIRYEKLMYLS